MTKQEIIDQLIAKGYNNDASATQQDLYTTIERGQLFSKSNRLNAGWARGKYLVASFDETTYSLQEYVEQWKTKVSRYQNQFLCLEINNNEWKFFDYSGKQISFVVNPPQLELAGAYLAIKKAPLDYPLQQIYYGAPGTGKSHEIKKLTKGESVIRTTFHPDSDYSTFVGAYKPTMEDVDVKVVPVVVKSGISLEDSGTYKEKRIVYKFIKQAFLKAYLLAWKNYTDEKTVTSVIDSTSTGIDADDEREIISSAIGTGNPNLFNNGNPNEIPDNNQGNRGEDKTKLIAEPSCKPVFLIIEEINRGNCAQIFGDLFQLLDRSENGFSEYPIVADTDLQQEIARAFKEDGDYKLTKDINVNGVVKDYISTRKGDTLSKDIQDGHILLLPPNLYIWATMNTSDQSLFPIDSAFKRRWTWKYMKISNAYKKDETTGEYLKDADGKKIPLDWKIVVKDKDGNAVTINDKESLPWWDFINKINDIIASMTSSADKQLGYFFCKAAKDGTIDEETFVSKVIFYLWNDVFKDYGFEDASLFQYKETVDGKEVANDLTFPDFYDEDGMHVNTVRLKDFLEKVMKWTKDKEEQR